MRISTTICSREAAFLFPQTKHTKSDVRMCERHQHYKYTYDRGQIESECVLARTDRHFLEKKRKTYEHIKNRERERQDYVGMYRD